MQKPETRPTILLVEDDPAHARLILRTLERHGVSAQFRQLFNGEEALDYLFRRREFSSPESSPRPSLVLLDLRLPRIDGLEVLKRIKGSTRLRAIPVVVLTTSAAEPDVARAYRHNVNSYLVKPADYDALDELVKDVGRYWVAWNQQPKERTVDP